MPHAESIGKKMGESALGGANREMMIVDGVRLTRNARRSMRHWLSAGLVVCGIAAGVIACENKPEESSAAKQEAAPLQSGLVQLTPEESSRIALEVVPVARGQFRASREFPATVQPNENELAEVTTLIRGRVMKVYVDVGQDVKKGMLLAMLHSTDLGAAESAYLKAGAKLHEA